MSLNFEVEDQRKKGRPMWTWKKQVEEESMKVGLRMEDVLCQSIWCVDINRVAAGLMCIWPPSLVGIHDFKHWCVSLYATFVDFTKGFISVSRRGLWLILKQLGELCHEGIRQMYGIKGERLDSREESKLSRKE